MIPANESAHSTPDNAPDAASTAPGAPSVSAALGWQVRTTWRVLKPGVAHPETTSEHRGSEWAALLHASWLVRSEGASAVVEIVRIEIRDPVTGVWRAVHDPGAALDAVAEVARLRAAGGADVPGEGRLE